MTFRPPFLGTPSTGLTLLTEVGTTVSGLLEANSVYRVTAQNDTVCDLSDGALELGIDDDDTFLLLGEHPVEFKTTSTRKVLHAIPVTTSGLINVVKLDGAY
jgi:hypothetical protein